MTILCLYSPIRAAKDGFLDNLVRSHRAESRPAWPSLLAILPRRSSSAARTFDTRIATRPQMTSRSGSCDGQSCTHRISWCLRCRVDGQWSSLEPPCLVSSRKPPYQDDPRYFVGCVRRRTKQGRRLGSSWHFQSPGFECLPIQCSEHSDF